MIDHPVAASAAVLHVDLDRELPQGTLRPGTTDVAVVARADGLVVAFRMLEVTDWPQPVDVAALIDHVGLDALANRVRLADPRTQIGALPSLTLAVCTKDRPERVRRLLQSIVDLDVGDAARPRVLVVDNAPSDNATARVVGEFSGVDRVVEPRTGLDFARNRAVSETDTELVAFLDDDVVVDPGWYRGLRLARARTPEAGGFTGLVMPFALETRAQIAFEHNGGFGRGSQPRRFRSDMYGMPLFPLGSGVLGAGCNMVFLRAVLVDIGGFDPALDTGRPLPGGGDLDIFHRVVAAGHTMAYEPAMAVYHEHRRTLDELEHQYYTWGLGLMAYLDKTSGLGPSEAKAARRLRRWWGRFIARELLRPHRRRRRDVVAELRGGLKGVVGEYARSQRRATEIQRSAQ